MRGQEFGLGDESGLLPTAMAFCPISGNIVIAGNTVYRDVFILKVGVQFCYIDAQSVICCIFWNEL